MKNLFGSPQHAWRILGLDPRDKDGYADPRTGERFRVAYQTFYRGWTGLTVTTQDAHIIEGAWTLWRNFFINISAWKKSTSFHFNSALFYAMQQQKKT
jgi:hypothetical protein